MRERTLAGEAIYELDRRQLARARARSDRHPGAVPGVRGLLRGGRSARRASCPRQPRVIALDPKTLGETLGDVRTLAQATGRRGRGRRARRRRPLRASTASASRCAAWRGRAWQRSSGWTRSSSAGHWTPQMIELAGGEDVLGLPGEAVADDHVGGARGGRPEIVVVMPCGYDAARALAEAQAHAEELRALGARRVVAVDASAYFSRPGPRLIDGLELLAHMLHPEQRARRRRRARRRSAARGVDERQASPSRRVRPRWSSRPPPSPRRRQRRSRRRRRSPSAANGAARPLRSASAARPPPISPPTCAAPEMPAQGEADDEVDQDQRAHAALHQRDLTRAQLHGCGAHQPEHGAGGADGDRVRGDEQRAEATRRAARRRR